MRELNRPIFELKHQKLDGFNAANQAVFLSRYPFPIEVGKTIKDVKGRVAQQCKGSATFDNPVIIGRLWVKRVGSVESAIHALLKSRGKWRENVPAIEWFDTTYAEIDSVIKFIQQ